MHATISFAVNILHNKYIYTSFLKRFVVLQALSCCETERVKAAFCTARLPRNYMQDTRVGHF